MLTVIDNQPCPEGQPHERGIGYEMRMALKNLKPDQAIHLTKRSEFAHVYKAARRAGVKITARKQACGGWFVWRVDKSDTGNGAVIAG